MNRRYQHKNNKSDFRRFLEYRKGLSSFDKKLEAGSLIDKTESTDVDKAWKIIRSKINQTNNIYNIFSVITRISAMLTLPLLVFAIWSLFFQQQEEPSYEAQNEISWQNIQIPPGMRSQVVLPDGSNLWLNAGSKVRYSIPFTREKREIELTGEAYLEVRENKKSPFFVRTDNAAVEVLGTEFNVKSYPGSEDTEVALKEGKVKFRFLAADNKIKYCELEPNDYLQFRKDSKVVSVDNTNIEKYISWRNNIFILDDTPMNEVARLLEQWYGVKVILTGDEIMSYKITSKFNNEPLFRVLELLELSSPMLSLQYTPGKLDEKTKKASQSIVTITKKYMPM